MWSVEGPAIWAPISCIQLYLEDMTTHQTSISNQFAISVWGGNPLKSRHLSCYFMGYTIIS